jgi:putative ABC transport system substrate-binding protein
MSIARRRFLLCASAVLGAPLARAAPPTLSVAFVLTTSPMAEMLGPEPAHPILRAFLRELRALGYVEGRDLVLERRSAEGERERFAPILAELIARGTDLIVLPGHRELNRIAMEATKTIPIVIFAMNSPVEAGLVESLARPGGNITGLTVNSGPENEAKRLQLLKEALPRAARVAYFGTRSVWESDIGQAVRRAAPSLGVDLVHADLVPTNLEAALDGLRARRPDALFASLSAEIYAHRQRIAQFAFREKLPGIYPYLEMAAMGGLIAYGVNVVDLGRRAAHYVDKILKGAQPGDLPVERPTKFDLVVNLKAARVLGVDLGKSMLARANRVIE